MSSTRDKRNPAGGGGDAALPIAFVLLVVVSVGGIYGATHLAAILSDEPAPPTNPVQLVFGLFNDEVAWSTTSTVMLVAIVAVLLVLVVLAVAIRARVRGGGRKAQRVDRAAPHMGRGRDVTDLSRRGATATAVRLGGSKEHPGVPLGRSIAGGQPLFSNWENTIVDIWGTRTGKTTSMGIPSILAAPAACAVTSNKRDIVDATRGPRATHGTVWVFDPQGVIGEEPTWWWNPLTYVTDENKAAELAQHFASASRQDGARSDPFWENSGEDLLAGFLLAAAVTGKPISAVYGWLVDTNDDEPARAIAGQYPMIAARLRGFLNAPDETRGGIYSNAQAMARCLTNSRVLTWIDPPPEGSPRVEFDPARFARSTDTLYSLSMEGRGTAGAIVTALTAAVIDAAVQYATEQPAGRLAVPMVAVLDEAANVCRWAELPSLYSHFGSRGIVLRTILQSWSQGVGVWGEHGMRKLWSAANVKTYGGGVSETAFLNDLSQLIGDYDRETVSVSQGNRQRNVSRQLQRERILDVADLGALPKGRAIVLASGSRPTLVRTVPWMEGPHANEVKASIAAHDPQAATTIDQAYTELQTVATAESARTSNGTGLQW